MIITTCTAEQILAAGRDFIPIYLGQVDVGHGLASCGCVAGNV
jgi:hypothetical protein